MKAFLLFGRLYGKTEIYVTPGLVLRGQTQMHARFRIHRGKTQMHVKSHMLRGQTQMHVKSRDY